ncbi:kinase-like protein [Choiromyces venosus 120613-1]|uniref:non-specific serine/threonine protein kinase n=1 Tax=Choiromyces venosus 120613-1 TaxID=1336337 RepID=A0A3N4J090_9PEZI|nr:kinase-like protein [Choiromyces venosus 120613-1]
MSAPAHTRQTNHLEPDPVESYRLTSEYDGSCLRYVESALGLENGTTEWTVGEVLGRGGSSVVRKHLHEKTGRVRAVKTIEKGGYPFHAREFNIMAILNESEHRSRFVEFLGWFENRDRLFIAMEYFEKGDLRKHLDKPLGEEVVQIITMQVLNGLQVMHANNIAHRDLKPDNIFVVSMSPVSVKLGDFGISKRIQGDTSYRSQVYTNYYAAPEVLGIDTNSETSTYTNAVDMWSLGCVVYELLVGERLFSSLGHIMSFFYEKGKFPQQKLSKLATPSSGAAKSFIQGLVLLDPGKRPTAVDAAVNVWLQGLEIDAPLASSYSRCPTPVSHQYPTFTCCPPSDYPFPDVITACHTLQEVLSYNLRYPDNYNLRHPDNYPLLDNPNNCPLPLSLDNLKSLDNLFGLTALDASTARPGLDMVAHNGSQSSSENSPVRGFYNVVRYQHQQEYITPFAPPPDTPDKDSA